MGVCRCAWSFACLICSPAGALRGRVETGRPDRLPAPARRASGDHSITELAYAIHRSIRRSQNRARCGRVRKGTVASLSPTRPSSGVYWALVNRGGGRRKAARHGRDGTALSSTKYRTRFLVVGVTARRVDLKPLDRHRGQPTEP